MKVGLGDYIRDHPPSSTSPSTRTDLVIGVGSGTTGTRSLRTALELIGLKGCHWVRCTGGVGPNPWMQANKIMVEGNNGHNRLSEFDFRKSTENKDFICDTPTQALFLNIFLAFPKAKYLLTTRPSTEWAQSRVAHHPTAPPPFQQPCTSTVKDWSHQQLAQLFDLHNELVRCVVPHTQLLEFDLFTDPDDRIAGLMNELSNFVNRPISADMTFPGSSFTALEDSKEEATRNMSIGDANKELVTFRDFGFLWRDLARQDLELSWSGPGHRSIVDNVLSA